MLASFCMDTTEVTVAAYQGCVDAKACTEPQAREKRNYQDDCNWRAPGFEQHPVNCVVWSQATAFCAWRGARLPSSEEWHWAARGGDQGTKFPWGNEPPDARRLNACGRECLAFQKRKGWAHPEALYDEDDGFVTTAPVGSFPAGANPWGVLDLAGNVDEWTSNRGKADPRRPTDRMEDLRGVCGSTWPTGTVGLVVSDCARMMKDGPVSLTGFRCAKDR